MSDGIRPISSGNSPVHTQVVNNNVHAAKDHHEAFSKLLAAMERVGAKMHDDGNHAGSTVSAPSVTAPSVGKSISSIA